MKEFAFFAILNTKDLTIFIASLCSLAKFHKGYTVFIYAPNQYHNIILNFPVNFNLDIKFMEPLPKVNNTNDPPTIDNVLDNILNPLHCIQNLLDEFNIIYLNTNSYWQKTVPVDEFKFDFGGIELSKNKYEPGITYFTKVESMKYIIEKIKQQVNKQMVSEEINNELYKIIISAFHNKFNDITDEIGSIHKLPNNIYIHPNMDMYIDKEKLELDIGNRHKIITYDNEPVYLIGCPLSGTINNIELSKYIRMNLLNIYPQLENLDGFEKNQKIQISFPSKSINGFYGDSGYYTELSSSMLKKYDWLFMDGIQDVQYYYIGYSTILYTYNDLTKITPVVLKRRLLIPSNYKNKNLDILDDNNISYSFLKFNIPQNIRITELYHYKYYIEEKKEEEKEEEKEDIELHSKIIYDPESHIEFSKDKNTINYHQYIKTIAEHKFMIIYNDEEHDRCPQLTEAIAVGTIPILINSNNIEIHDDKFKENVHFLRNERENLVEATDNITEIEYETMVQNCVEYYKTTQNVESITREILTKLLIM